MRVWRVAAVATAIWIGAVYATTAAPPPAPPVEAYGRPPNIEAGELNTDGSRVAFIRNFAGRKDLRIIDPARPLAAQSFVVDFGRVRPYAVHWLAPDAVGADFRFVYSDPKKTKQGPVELQGLVLYRGVPSPTYKRDYLGVGVVSLLGADGGPVLAYTVEKNAWRLYELDPATGITGVERDSHPVKVGRADVEVSWIPDAEGRVRVRTVVHSPPVARFVIQVRDHDAPNAPWRTLTEWNLDDAELEEPFAPVGFGEDPDRLLGFRTNAHGETVLFALDLKSGAYEEVLPRRPGIEAAAVRRDPRTDRILAVDYLDDTDPLVWLDAEMGALHARAREALPNARVEIESWSLDRSRLLLSTTGPGDSGTWWLYEPATGRLSVVDRAYPMIPPEAVAEQRPFAYEARDGLTIPGYLTLPPGREPKGLPLVVMPHGGPAARDVLGFDWWAQAMASRGYAVLQPNFRGSKGFGAAFERAGWAQWGGAMQDDLTDGVRRLIEDGVVDAGRVCIVGASYGGYAALAGAAFTPELYRCAVSVAGVGDLAALQAYSAGPRGRETFALRYWRRAIGADAAKVRAASPIFAADRVRAPVLLIHGAHDTIVPARQSEAMYEAVTRAGKTVEHHVLDAEDHFMTIETTRTRMLRLTLDFLAKHNPAD